MGPTHARERAEIRFIPLRHFATGPWVGQDSSRLVPALPKGRSLAVAPPGGQTQEKSCCGKEEGQMQTQNFLSILCAEEGDMEWIPRPFSFALFYKWKCSLYKTAVLKSHGKSTKFFFVVGAFCFP